MSSVPIVQRIHICRAIPCQCGCDGPASHIHISDGHLTIRIPYHVLEIVSLVANFCSKQAIQLFLGGTAIEIFYFMSFSNLKSSTWLALGHNTTCVIRRKPCNGIRESFSIRYSLVTVSFIRVCCAEILG